MEIKCKTNMTDNVDSSWSNLMNALISNAYYIKIYILSFMWTSHLLAFIVNINLA